MRRPIGVMLLAGAAGLAGLYQVYLILVYLGIAKFNFIGNDVIVPDRPVGPGVLVIDHGADLVLGRRRLLGSACLRAPVRTLHQPVHADLGLLRAPVRVQSYEAQTIPWLLAGFIYLYLSYPGVQKPFVENEMARLTPEQRAAMEQMAAANVAAMQAKDVAAQNSAPGM